MTAEQLRAQFPETYNTIFNAGVANEHARINNWLSQIDNNKQAVLNGIKSGANFEGTEFQEAVLSNSIKEHLKSKQNTF